MTSLNRAIVPSSANRSILRHWCLTVIIMMLTTCGLGLALDAVLAIISWNYIYPEGAFLRRGFVWGWFVGTIAAKYQVPKQIAPRPCSLWGLVWVYVMMVVLGSAFGFGCGILVSKWTSPPVAQFLAPPTRVFSCVGLVRGAFCGGILFLLGLLLADFRTASTSDANHHEKTGVAELPQRID